jgi:hypothetical protein
MSHWKIKKSQMEMMGLAIIVILISFGLLFFLRFSLMKPSTTPTQEYKKSALASNFINTLVETDAANCSNVKFSDLFKDCAENNNGGAGGLILCRLPGMQIHSCEFLRLQTVSILDETLAKWGIDYYFIATTDKKKPTQGQIFDPIPINGECQGDRKLAIQPFSLSNKVELDIMLFICG